MIRYLEVKLDLSCNLLIYIEFVAPLIEKM